MQYNYKILTKDKIQKIGQIEADNETQLIEYLHSQQATIIAITPIKSNLIDRFSFEFDRVSLKDLVRITRQLSIMLTAGITLVEALQILFQQTKKKTTNLMLKDLLDDVKSGLALSTAMQKHYSTFGRLYIALVRAGEASGKLDSILTQVATNLERSQELRNRLINALIYPTLLVVSVFGVLFFLTSFVMPSLTKLYTDFQIDLPISTQITIFVANFMSHYWLMVLGVVIFLSALSWKFITSKKGRSWFDKLILTIPIIGNVIAVTSLVDTTRTLSILVGSGVAILPALDITSAASSNTFFQKSLENVKNRVEKGTSISVAMTEQEIFPVMLVQMVEVGEKTGELDTTLMKVANYFDEESKNVISIATAFIQPIILIFMGVTIGFLFFSVLTPIYSIVNQIQ